MINGVALVLTQSFPHTPFMEIWEHMSDHPRALSVFIIKQTPFSHFDRNVNTISESTDDLYIHKYLGYVKLHKMKNIWHLPASCPPVMGTTLYGDLHKHRDTQTQLQSSWRLALLTKMSTLLAVDCDWWMDTLRLSESDFPFIFFWPPSIVCLACRADLHITNR